jgi:hypothetical protein
MEEMEKEEEGEREEGMEATEGEEERKERREEAKNAIVVEWRRGKGREGEYSAALCKNNNERKKKKRFEAEIALEIKLRFWQALVRHNGFRWRSQNTDEPYTNTQSGYLDNGTLSSARQLIERGKQKKKKSEVKQARGGSLLIGIKKKKLDFPY